MHTYISLLRGIHVSGKHKLPMVALKKIYHALGGQQVTTYIQRGNVIFQAACASTALAKEISQTIQKEFGYIVPVLIQEIAFFSKVEAPYGTINSLKPRVRHGPLHVTGKRSVSLLSAPCTYHNRQ